MYLAFTYQARHKRGLLKHLGIIFFPRPTVITKLNNDSVTWDQALPLKVLIILHRDTGQDWPSAPIIDGYIWLF